MSRARVQQGEGSQSDPGPTHIKDLIADPQNRRSHNPRNIGMVVDALHEVGAARSIVIDEDNVILAGNGVTEACAEAGITKVRVIEADGHEVIAVRRRGLTEEQKRYLAIADNRSAELAQWNSAQFREDLGAGLEFGKFFTPEELSKVLGPEVKSGLTDPDEVPAERLTGIVAGDLFELGRHRLLCGDCTVAGDVARVMGTEQAVLLFTSPPYADAREYKGGNLTPSHLAGFLVVNTADVVCVNLGLIRRDSAIVPYWNDYIAAAESTGLLLLSWNVWDKGIAKSVAQKTAMFPLEHEWVLVFGATKSRLRPTIPNPGAGTVRYPSNRQADGSVLKGSAKVVRERREMGSVYRGGTVHASAEHPAMFPVEFPQAYIAACSDTGDVVSEPFAGSGSTLIASEQIDRRCFAIELAPIYCQVIIDRWEAFTGHTAQKVGEAIRV